MISESSKNVDSITNTDVIASFTGQAVSTNASGFTAEELAKQRQVVRRRPGVSPTQSLDGDSLTGDPSSLSLHDKQDALRLSEIAQENSAPIDLVEAEAATVVTENTADTVINDEVRACATTSADTSFVPEDLIDTIDLSLYTTQPKDAQPSTSPNADMQKERNRLSDKIREVIVQKRQNGNPDSAIALYYEISTTQVKKVLYQYVVAHGHRLNPTKYSIFKGGCSIKSAELLGISKKDFVRIDIDSNGEITLERFQLDQGSDSLALPAQPKRKRAKAEQTALDKKILYLFEEGSPSQAIALKCGVSENFVTKTFFRLVQEKKLSGYTPSYDVIKGGCPFTSIKTLGITKDDYVRIERNEAGKLVITKFDVSTLQDLSID